MFPEKRRRRRRRQIVPILLAVAILLALYVGSSGTDAVASRDFYDTTAKVMIDLQSDSAMFFELGTGPLLMDRDEYVAALEQVESSLVEGLEAIPAAEDLPVEVRGTRRLVVRTLESWSQGVASYKSATLSIVDLPTSGLGQTELATAVTELRVADELYRVLTDEMDELGKELEIAEATLPELRFVPDNAVTPGYITALADRLGASDVLTGRRALEIINVVLDPAPLGGGGFDAERLPFTEQLSVQVVVANQGNLPENSLTIVLTIQNVTTGELEQQSHTIDQLDAGAQEAVGFSELAVEAGQLYRVTIRAVIEAVDLDAPGAETFEVFISENAEIPDQTTGTTP